MVGSGGVLGVRGRCIIVGDADAGLAGFAGVLLLRRWLLLRAISSNFGNPKSGGALECTWPTHPPSNVNLNAGGVGDVAHSIARSFDETEIAKILACHAL